MHFRLFGHHLWPIYALTLAVLLAACQPKVIPMTSEEARRVAALHQGGGIEVEGVVEGGAGGEGADLRLGDALVRHGGVERPVPL